jgi:hypothetical protein
MMVTAAQSQAAHFVFQEQTHLRSVHPACSAPQSGFGLVRRDLQSVL